MILKKKLTAALVFFVMAWLPASSIATHPWGYEEVIFLDSLQEWTSEDRLSACQMLKDGIDNPSWDPRCTLAGEGGGGRINRGCNNSDPGNIEGGCEAELVFCVYKTCSPANPHVPLRLGMTAFRCETPGYYYDHITDSCGIPFSKPGKERGGCKPAAGNPCNPVTGNKFQRDTDYSGAGPFPLRLDRFYNSVRVQLPLPARTGATPTSAAFKRVPSA